MANANASRPGWFKRFRTAHPIIMNLCYILITAFVLIYGTLIFLDFWTHHGETATVPDVRFKSYTDAKQKLRDAGLDIAVTDSVYNSSIAPGTVLESWPHAGAVVKPGREIYVTISSYQPKKVKINGPLTGVSSQQAISTLHSLGIANVQIHTVPSQFDDVVRALYRGRELTVGSEIPVNGTVVLEVGDRSLAEYHHDVLEDSDGSDASLLDEELDI